MPFQKLGLMADLQRAIAAQGYVRPTPIQAQAGPAVIQGRDVLAGAPLKRKLVCRTFSDCTTGPRNGLKSGCYPLDPFYKDHPDRVELTRAKRAAESARGGRRRSTP